MMARKEYEVKWTGDFYGWGVVAPDGRTVEHCGKTDKDKSNAEKKAARLNRVLNSQGGYDV
jgi:hypothetical protein